MNLTAAQQLADPPALHPGQFNKIRQAEVLEFHLGLDLAASERWNHAADLAGDLAARQQEIAQLFA